MKTTDFETLDSFWLWLQNKVMEKFCFLVNDKGFFLSKIESTSNQLSIQFLADDVEIGLWFSYGNRPEVYIKKNGSRKFTNELARQAKLNGANPIKSGTFGVRTKKSDFDQILDHYAKILKEILH